MSAFSDRVVAQVTALAETSAEKYRNQLSKNIHVADISLAVLRAAAPGLKEAEHFGILDAFNNAANHSSQSLKNSIRQVKADKWQGLVYVSDPVYGDFLISGNRSALQQNTSKVLAGLTAVYPRVKKLLDAKLGYTAGTFAQSRTPVLDKLREIYKRLPQLSANKIAGDIIKLQNEYRIETKYSFEREQQLAGILGTATVIVNFRTQDTTQTLSKISADVTRKVKKYLQSGEFLQGLLADQKHNITLDISNKIREALGVKVTKPSGKLVTGKKQVDLKGTQKAQAFKPPTLRNVQGQFFSLDRLLIILNEQMQDVVSANMGDGDRRDILNYRTGRFASTISVQRLSMGREGTISAFYKYMKYPYATFSQGGRQQSPRSRDPKLLIARSIRDIASQHVSNALRSVNV